MSTYPTGAPGGQEPDPAAPGAGQPSEEELRKAYEAELSKVSTTDMMAQAAVSLLNLGARRLQAERDLDQVRDAIDGVRALLGILERTISQELGPLREALSQLQMAYAREVQTGPDQPEADQPGAGARAPGAGAGQPGAGAGQPGAGAGQPGAAQADAGNAPGKPSGGDETPPSSKGPGPAESSGRLWVPGR